MDEINKTKVSQTQEIFKKEKGYCDVCLDTTGNPTFCFYEDGIGYYGDDTFFEICTDCFEKTMK